VNANPSIGTRATRHRGVQGPVRGREQNPVFPRGAEHPLHGRAGNALTPDNPYDVRTLEGSHLRWLTDPAPAALVLGEPAALTAPSA